MTIKHTKAITKIVRSKADFLIFMEFPLAEWTQEHEDAQAEVFEILRKRKVGIRQRAKAHELTERACGIWDKRCAKLGRSIMRTFRFVSEHRAKLTHVQRKRLGIKAR